MPNKRVRCHIVECDSVVECVLNAHPHECRDAVVKVLRGIAHGDFSLASDYQHSYDWIASIADRIEREGLPPEGGEKEK